jgi:hypothetical protein
MANHMIRVQTINGKIIGYNSRAELQDAIDTYEVDLAQQAWVEGQADWMPLFELGFAEPPERVPEVKYKQPAPVIAPIECPPYDMKCPFCAEVISSEAIKCKHCGSNINAAKKSDATAGCLGLLLGPVGLWYKGHFAAGFGWLVMVLIFGIIFPPLAPLLWLGMGAHAAGVQPKG